MISPDYSKLTPEKKRRAIELLQEKVRRKRENFVDFYQPNKKQAEFHKMGNYYAQRCFMAGNQLGKSLSGAAEYAYHLSGEYPDWWQGLRFSKPVLAWACGVTPQEIRDSIQLLLCGSLEKNEIGYGTIKNDQIHSIQRAMGTPNCLDYIMVKHKSGGLSVCRFKAYSQGRQKFQASTIDIVWFDEEPPEEIYSEGLTRTNNGQFGPTSLLTYTPLLGMTNLTHKFEVAPSEEQVLIRMGIADVDHYSEERKKQIIDAYPEHEREARKNGIPILGSGRVFPVLEEAIKWEPHAIPKFWAQIIGMDFGYDHPQAFVHGVWDRDTDIIYITKGWKQSQCSPVNAAGVIKPWGDWIPVAWPHDGKQHDKGGSNEELASQYRNAGLNMYHTHATHEGGGYGTEAGITAMIERFQSGRLKVNKYFEEWFEEYRIYHRKDGLIVKERDDLMSATRQLIMMLRIAETEPFDEEDYIPPRNQNAPLGWS